MLLRLGAKNISRGPFVWRGISARYSSSSGTDGVGDKEVSDVVLKERRRQFNLEMLEMMKDLTKFPEEDFAKLQFVAEQDLTEKEKQLDEKLAQFLRKYALESKVFEARNTLPDTVPKASKQSAHGFPYLVPSSSGQPYTKQELFVRQMKHASSIGKLGATLEDIYFPHNDIFNPPSVENTSISKLMAAGVHLGQSKSLWRSSTQPYIYGEYKGIHIIDLNVTLSYLKRAAQVVEGVAENGGIILFLGTREGQKRALQKAAERVNGYYVASRWIPGTLTNPTVISSTWERHEVDYNGVPTGRELTLDESVSIIKPDLLVVLNPTENRNALLEAMKVHVPTIGIIDTDSEPSLVTYPIPGNDDSLRSVNLLVSILAKAGGRGRATRLSKMSELQT